MRVISPKQLAQAIDVSEASVKRWCDQGRIPFEKTAGGHRKLHLENVLAFLRTQHIKLTHPECLELPSMTGHGNLTLQRAALAAKDALLRGDRDAFEKVIFALFIKGESMTSIGDQVIAPAFRDIGERWSCGEIEVYQERLGYEICRDVLGSLRRKIPSPKKNATVAIGGSLTGDHYDLATMLVSLTLQEAGWNAVSLGSHLPFSTFEKALVSFSPTLLWISVSFIENMDQFLEGYARIYEKARARGVVVAVGGRALTYEIRQKILFTSYSESLKDLAEFSRPFLRSSHADI